MELIARCGIRQGTSTIATDPSNDPPSSRLNSLDPSQHMAPRETAVVMTKLPVHGTHSRTGSLKKKKNDTAADDCRLVDREKSKMREDKKKKRAEEKKAEEEKKKKSDQEKATANSVTISPPSTNDDDALIDGR
jgi:hypothetical protein